MSYKDTSFEKRAKLMMLDYVIVALVFLFLISAAWWIPIALKAVGQAADIGLYITSGVSAAIAAYSLITTLRLKQADIQKAYQAAIGVIYSDTQECLCECETFVKQAEDIPERTTPDWNDLVEEMTILEARFHQKQDRLLLISQQLALDVIPKIQDLYYHMYQCWMRSKKYSVAAGAAAQMEEQRSNLIKHINNTITSLMKKYSDLNISELEELQSQLKQGNS